MGKKSPISPEACQSVFDGTFRSAFPEEDWRRAMAGSFQKVFHKSPACKEEMSPIWDAIRERKEVPAWVSPELSGELRTLMSSGRAECFSRHNRLMKGLVEEFVRMVFNREPEMRESSEYLSFAKRYMRFNRDRAAVPSGAAARERFAAQVEIVRARGGLTRLRDEDIARILAVSAGAAAPEPAPPPEEAGEASPDDGFFVELPGHCGPALADFVSTGVLNRAAVDAARELLAALVPRGVPKTAAVFWGRDPPAPSRRGARDLRFWAQIDAAAGRIRVHAARPEDAVAEPGDLWVFGVATRAGTAEVFPDYRSEGIREVTRRLSSVLDIAVGDGERADWSGVDALQELACIASARRDLHEVAEAGLVDPELVEEARPPSRYNFATELVAACTKIATDGRIPNVGDRFSAPETIFQWDGAKLVINGT